MLAHLFIHSFTHPNAMPVEHVREAAAGEWTWRLGGEVEAVREQPRASELAQAFHKCVHTEIYGERTHGQYL